MELELETGGAAGAPMPRSRSVKRLSDGELAELRAQLIDRLDRCWIQHSTAGHAAAVFARKQNGTWRMCYDYRGLNAITRPAVETLPHIDALLDGTRGSRFFTKLDLASSFHQLRYGPPTGGRRASGRSWASVALIFHFQPSEVWEFTLSDLQRLRPNWMPLPNRSEKSCFEWNVVPFGLQGASSLLMRA